MWDLQQIGVEQWLLGGNTPCVQVIVEVRVESLPPTSAPVPWWAIAVPIAVAVLLIIAVFVVLYIVSPSRTYIPCTCLHDACLHTRSFDFL